jgi:hypothetical protein
VTDYAELHRRLWQAVQEQDGKIGRDTAAFVRRLVEKLQSDGYQITLEVEAELSAYLGQIDGWVRGGIETAANTMISGAAIGSSMRNETVARLATEAFFRQWQDGKRLSERLWDLKTETRRGFGQILAEGAQTGQASGGLIYDLQRQIEMQGARFRLDHKSLNDWATRLAATGKDLLKNPAARARWEKALGKVEAHVDTLRATGTRHAAQAVLKKIRAAVEQGKAEAIDEAVKWWMYDKQLYYLKRIVRTEMADAGHQAVLAATRDDQDIVGYWWRLSSGHPEADICDYYAGIELGLGKGVWPKDQAPQHKAHPHCMCLIIPRVTPRREKGAANYPDLLRSLTPEKRSEIMPRWAQSALDDGVKIEQLMRSDGMGLITKNEAESAKII